MSEGEYRKLRLHLRILTICVIALIALLGANLVHRVINPESTSFPQIKTVQGPPGKAATIDYSIIDKYIEAQFAALPKPMNGINGQPGQSIVGPQGPQGVSGKSIKGDKGAKGDTGKSGKNGENATPSPVLQIQVDHLTCQLQQKYDTSDIWVSFVQLPKPCEVIK